MFGITRMTPWTELAGLHRDLDSVFGRVFRETGGSAADTSWPSFSPAAEVRREGDQWRVSLALPGVAPDQVQIDVVGRTVRVKGERKSEHAGTEPVLSEITYGRFEREFTLPEEIDAKRVQATYRNGLLDLALPLSEGAKPHRIEIRPAADGKQLTTA